MIRPSLGRHALHVAVLLAVSGVLAPLDAQIGMPRRKVMLPPPTATTLTGYEIVAGAEVSVEPLQLATPTAQCPAGKLPIGGGYEFRGPADAAYGFEVRGVSAYRTNGRYMQANARNANLGARGTVRAYAVCIIAPAGTRQIEISSSANNIAIQSRCTDAERVIGGGAKGGALTQLNVNAPQGPATKVGLPGSGWSVEGVRNGIGEEHSIAGLMVCAPASAVDGWEDIQSAPTGIGARGRAQLELRCPAGKKMLVAGVYYRTTSSDLVVNRLMISEDGSATASVLNRNIGGGQINPYLVGVCARVA